LSGSLISSPLSFAATGEPVEGDWTRACVAEPPAIITVAPTLEMVRVLLIDAPRVYLLGLGRPDIEPANGDAPRGSIEVMINAA
jgi:hypothetical protein